MERHGPKTHNPLEQGESGANEMTDDLTYRDYLDIYEELRGHNPDTGKYALSVRQFIALIGSTYSTGQWSKFHRELMNHIPHTMRTELRSAVKLPPAPLLARDVAVMIESGEVPFRLVGPANQTVAEIVVKGPKKIRPRQRTATFEATVGDQLNAARLAAGLSWNEIAGIALRSLEIDPLTK